MTDKNEITFITQDKNMRDGNLVSGDINIMNAASSGEGLITLSKDELLALATQAKIKYDQYGVIIRQMMTKERAKYVKELRMKKKYSWRGVAFWCHAEWQGPWSPPSNQLAGMQLCKIAGEWLKEEID